MDCHSLDFRVLLQGQRVSSPTPGLIGSAGLFWKLGTTRTSVFLWKLRFSPLSICSQLPAQLENKICHGRHNPYITLWHGQPTRAAGPPRRSLPPYSTQLGHGHGKGWVRRNPPLHVLLLFFLAQMLLYICLACELPLVPVDFNFTILFLSEIEKHSKPQTAYYIRTFTEHI